MNVVLVIGQRPERAKALAERLGLLGVDPSHALEAGSFTKSVSHPVRRVDYKLSIGYEERDLPVSGTRRSAGRIRT